VFGRGGKTLNNLKRETGTRIVVDAERGVIQIAANSMRAVQQARSAIQNILVSFLFLFLAAKS
jgi:polyribonucleotide nucleotidyltransferase